MTKPAPDNANDKFRQHWDMLEAGKDAQRPKTPLTKAELLTIAADLGLPADKLNTYLGLQPGGFERMVAKAPGPFPKT